MKTELISLTLDTSHSSIAPSAPSEQSRLRDDFTQLATALLSSALDCGENATWPTQEFGNIEASTAKKMTWWYEGDQIGSCWCIMCVYVCDACPSVCVCTNVRVRNLLACTASILEPCHEIFLRPRGCGPVGVLVTVAMEISTQSQWDNGKWILPLIVK